LFVSLTRTCLNVDMIATQDGGGTIDAGELLEALAAADMEVTPEEVADMIREFGKDEITFPQVNLAYTTSVA
jgi:Ca2+-binding EF-hand superfamily protein